MYYFRTFSRYKIVPYNHTLNLLCLNEVYWYTKGKIKVLLIMTLNSFRLSWFQLITQKENRYGVFGVL